MDQTRIWNLFTTSCSNSVPSLQRCSFRHVTVSAAGGAPNFKVVDPLFLDNKLKDSVNPEDCVDHENGCGRFFESLPCVVAGEPENGEFPLQYETRRNLYGIIGSKQKNAVICIDSNGVICVGKLDIKIVKIFFLARVPKTWIW